MNHPVQQCFQKYWMLFHALSELTEVEQTEHLVVFQDFLILFQMIQTMIYFLKYFCPLNILPKSLQSAVVYDILNYF